MIDHLIELEERVTRRWLEAVAERPPLWGFAPADLPDWSDVQWEPLPPGTPQFPREQWVSHPYRRAMTLILCDRMLDFDLDDEKWLQVCFLMQYGGKERVA